MFGLGPVLTLAHLFFQNRLKKLIDYFNKNWKFFLILGLTLLLGIFVYFAITHYQKKAKDWETKYTNLKKSVDKVSVIAKNNVHENQKTVYVSRIVYKDREAKQQIIYVKQKELNDAYTKTNEGATLCRDAERVRQIDQLDADLFTSAAAKDSR